MKRQTTCTILLLILFGFQSKSQLIDVSVLKNYPPGAIEKLFEIVKHTQLSAEQQKLIADHYQKTDSTVKIWLFQNRSIAEIDSLQTSANRIVYKILTEKQTNQLVRDAAMKFSATASIPEIEYIKEEYKPDSASIEKMASIMASKYVLIYQNYFFSKNENNIESFVGRNMASSFDVYKFYPMLYAKKFIDDYLQKLTSIKKFPDTIGKKIRNSFLGTLRENKFTDWSKRLTDITRYYLPDTLYFSELQQDELSREATRLSTADRYNLINLHHVSNVAYEIAYPLIWRKNYNNALLQYTYATYLPARCDSLIYKNSRYYDSTVETTLLLNGALQPASQFAIALRYKDELKLRPTLTDSLLQHAMHLAALRDSILLLDPFSIIDFGAYEAAQLNFLLTEEQYTLLLGFKNRQLAIADAKNDWQEMGVRDLQNSLNKDQVINDIAQYYMNKYTAWNRYANDKIAQWAAINALENTKPYALKILDPLRWSGSTKKSTNNLQLKW